MGEIGEALRKARIELGVDLRRASADTRISQGFLAALEEERFSDLPAPVYVRGFLRSYAAYLGLDGQKLVTLLPPEFAPEMSAQRMDFVPGPGRPSRDPWSARPAGEEAPGVSAAADGGAESGKSAGPEPFPGRRTVGGRRGPRAAAAPPRAGREPPVERGLPLDPGDDANQLVGLLLLGLAVLVALGIIGGIYLILTRGDGDSPLALGALDTATPGPRTSTVVPPPGSPTAATVPAASGETVTPRAGSPAAGGGTATAPPSGSTPTAPPRATAPAATNTAVPSPTPSPSPTATPMPSPTPTATPTPPPPPTPTPVVHPREFEECIENNGICGGTEVRVVCAPDGWFVDLEVIDGLFPAESYGWPVQTVTRLPGVSLATSAAAACGG